MAAVVYDNATYPYLYDGTIDLLHYNNEDFTPIRSSSIRTVVMT